MTERKTITVFGAAGKVGGEFVTLALEGGYPVRAFVRNRSRFAHADNPRVEVIEGNATSAVDVANAVEGADVVTSFLGNPGKGVQMMRIAADNIMTAAAAQPTPPRCLMISSVGVGGSSWLIKSALTLIGGRAGFDDYERAEARVRNDTSVPFTVIRPYALTDKPATGKYKVLGSTAHLAKPITRADVSRFFFDCLEETRWDGPTGVNVGGA